MKKAYCTMVIMTCGMLIIGGITDGAKAKDWMPFVAPLVFALVGLLEN